MLLLTPSAGLGGGIERYLTTVEECLRAGGAEVLRLNLHEPGDSRAARLRFAVRTLACAWRSGHVHTVATGHPNLIPLGAVAAWLTRARRAPVVFYGNDIWSLRRVDRAILTRHRTLRPLTISSYSAGALSTIGLAPILRPGISPSWRATLLAAADHRRPSDSVPTVLSVFRLNGDDWEDKGLRVLLDALTAVREDLGPVRLVLAGQGPADEAIRALVSAHPNTELHESPDDETLASLYGAADLFILSTRTKPPRSGEGYGIVLLEAQLAGCPVVGPTSGGSHDAYVDGVTGATPADESAEALAVVIAAMLGNADELSQTSKKATEWARVTTDPEAYARDAFVALTGLLPTTEARVPIPRQRRPIVEEPACTS